MEQSKEGRHSVVSLTLAASLAYGVNCGIRSNYGVLLNPISANSGVDYALVSFVLAVAQLSFGIMQPVFGVLSMRKSNSYVLRLGAVLVTTGLLTIPFCKSLWTLLLALGFVLPCGTAALSFGVLMSALTPQLPRSIVPTASGIVSASSGVGSMVFSPVIQMLTAALGLLGAMAFLSVPAIFLFPVAIFLCRNGDASADEKNENAGLLTLVREAAASRDYRFLLAGFFTCGFHMAIIETHLYTQITTYGFSDRIAAYAFSVYGITTLIGSILSGGLCGKFPMKNVLGGLYGSRVILVGLFLLLPKTAPVIFGYSILLGLTGASTVPPTSGLTERLFGPVRLAALFGVVFLSHQIGSFFSAWLGGICLTATGGYTLIWAADIVLSGIAAAVSLKIKV